MTSEIGIKLIKMLKNVGIIDKGLRIIIGLMLLSLVFLGQPILWGWIGLVPLSTGLINWCPLYGLLGFSTCSVRGKA